MDTKRLRCRHQGNEFVAQPDGTLRCSGHGWVLDPATMTYRNPCGLKHSSNAPAFDLPRQHERADLARGEFTVRYINHACVVMKAGALTIATDPWCIGPAFMGGWWLRNRSPEDWLDAVCEAALIYISHNHTDHLNEATLRVILDRKPGQCFIVPPFPSVRAMLERVGALPECIITAEWGKPTAYWASNAERTERIGEPMSLTILPDGSGRDDSALLIEYRGWRVLNTVDCNNPPTPPADVLLSAYAGGSSGYPVCWRDMYDDAEIARIVGRNLRRLRTLVKNTLTATGARVWMPFAGEFVEADPEITRVNPKNNPWSMYALMRDGGWDGQMIPPLPGDFTDMAHGGIHCDGDSPALPNDDEDRAVYALPHGCALTADDVSAYFRETGFRTDDRLVVHVIETSDDRREMHAHWAYDFKAGVLLEDFEGVPDRVLRISVPSRVWRAVVRDRRPWEEMAIGFHARMWRRPDRYNFDVWNAMQNGVTG